MVTSRLHDAALGRSMVLGDHPLHTVVLQAGGRDRRLQVSSTAHLLTAVPFAHCQSLGNAFLLSCVLFDCGESHIT